MVGWMCSMMMMMSITNKPSFSFMADVTFVEEPTDTDTELEQFHPPDAFVVGASLRASREG